MLSIIICNRDAAKWKNVTGMYARILANVEHEIIGIHDATGMCEGYNRAIARARGDLLAFSHDDVEFLSDSFGPNLTRHLKDFDVIGLAGTRRCVAGNWGAARPPYLLGQIAQVARNGFPVLFFGVYPTPRRAEMMDGVFLACRREVCEQIKFDAATFPGWHAYDADFTYAAHLKGLRVAVASDLFAIHHSWGTRDAAWKKAAASFCSKYKIPATPPRVANLGGTLAKTKQEIVALMSEALRVSAEP